MRITTTAQRRTLAATVVAAACILAASNVHAQGLQNSGKAPPLPHITPLAQPKPLNQVGLPVQATRAATPADNPQTPAKIALGEKLFFDPRLSADGTVACATCHDPARAFTDGRPVSVGIHGRAGQRNSPTILNALYNVAQFWDGRAKTLEEQAELPIVNPSEMGQPNIEAAVAAVAAIPEYQRAFKDVFGNPPNGADLARAIASYERSQVSFGSPFDHFMAGDQGAISDSAKRGWQLFNSKARCNKCHALTDTSPDSTFFMDRDFHNIGIGIIRHNVNALSCKAESLVNSRNAKAIDQAAIETDLSALGRFLVSKKETDIASFKTPGLRNIVMTAPYFHDGSQATLWDVMDHYNKGDGVRDPYLDQDMQPLALTEDEINDVIAFLATLTSPEYADRAAKGLERQRAIAATSRPQRDTKRAFGPKAVQPKPDRSCGSGHAH
ncbi:MAG TPA: cytochrome c peroxidase [Candidatus Baltobacteraceae bacterium]|nr:cytochrome c peroxidase [Candidatus Baltobacteraceae bacterium]